MNIIDGANGEGGGQIFRTSLSLSMCLGIPVRIENIRSGRQKPGLLRQHLACLRASREICNADVSGDQLGSTCVEFRPGKIKSGKFKIAIGTAGSTSLVFQTVLPALLMANGVSEVCFEGGTHNNSAPSYEFISQSFIPVLERMNIRVDTRLDSYGFYPNGGGSWTAKIYPMTNVHALKLLDRGNLISRRAVAISSKLPAHITQRELDHIQKKCDWNTSDLTQHLVNSCGPGNLVSLQLRFNGISEVFDSVGQIRTSAERVADKSIRYMNRYLNTNAVVGCYLCDQLLLPMVIAGGGSFTTLEPSLHTRTNIDVIESLAACYIESRKLDEDHYSINVTPH